MCVRCWSLNGGLSSVSHLKGLLDGGWYYVGKAMLRLSAKQTLFEGMLKPTLTCSTGHDLQWLECGSEFTNHGQMSLLISATNAFI